MLKSAIVSILSIMFLFQSDLFAQGKESYSRYNSKQTTFRDISQEISINGEIISQCSGDITLISPIITSYGGKSVVYTKEGVDSHVYFSRLFRGSKRWEEYSCDINDGLSAFSEDLEVYGFPQKKRMTTLYVFTNSDPFYCNRSKDDGRTWHKPYLMNGFGSDSGVKALYKKSDGTMIALFCSNGAGFYDSAKERGMVYRCYSFDDGISWTNPEIAVKHNLYEIESVSVSKCGHSKHNGKYYMVANDPATSDAMFSFSEDNGQTWSYPTLMPSLFAGKDHSIHIFGHDVYIIFKDNYIDSNSNYINSTFGNILVWHGNIKSLVNKSFEGQFIRLTNTNSDSNASVIKTKRNKAYFVVQSKWDDSESIYIKGYHLKHD